MTLKIMDSYNTQQESIANKARNRGISPSLVSTYFHNRLSNIYNTDPECEELWALGKAEYEVWKKFCKIDVHFNLQYLTSSQFHLSHFQ